MQGEGGKEKWSVDENNVDNQKEHAKEILVEQIGERKQKKEESDSMDI
jgi:hypothetical protein